MPVSKTEIRMAMAEITRMRTTKDFITEGLTFLREKSGGTFDFSELEALDFNDTLWTNIDIKNAESSRRKQLRVVITPRSEIFTNVPDADNPAGAYEPSLKNRDKAAAFADNEAFKSGDLSNEVLKEAHADYLQGVKIEEGYTKDINPAITPTTKTAVLLDIARRAVLQGYVSFASIHPGDTLTPAQQAIITGIRQGEAEIKLMKAIPFIEGLEFLKTQSKGLLDTHYEISSHRNEIEIQITGPRTYEQTAHFPPVFMKTDLNGQINDASEDEPLGKGEILRAIAKIAVFAGRIPAACREQNNATSTAQKVVLEAIQGAEGERALARLAASGLIEELESQKRLLGKDFHFEVSESANSPVVILRTNPGKAGSLQIMVNGNGVINMGKDVYNAFDAAEASVVRMSIKKSAAAQKPQRNNRTPYPSN